MSDKISVLLVDDHSLVRRGFRRILEDEPDITVAGEASDGDEAVQLARELQSRRHRDGLRVARHERARCHQENSRGIPGPADPDAEHALRKTRWCARRSTPARADIFSRMPMDLDLRHARFAASPREKSCSVRAVAKSPRP